MTAFDPRTTSEIFESLKQRLQNRIPELTNFIETSFNYVFTNSFSEQQHEVETAALATQLSGWVDYTGKTITDDDLRELGVDGANAAEINQYMDSAHLDEFAKGFGVTRDEGTQATGILNVTTLQTVTIPEGVEFGTQPDENGNFVSFETTTSETISGAQDDYPVEIQAVDVGSAGNVAPNTVTYMPNPPVGVDSVTNLNPISGGIDEQSDESLRDDVKSAVVESAEGGTVDGVEGYIENNTDAISALVQEKYEGDEEHGDYAHADVIVFGGEEQNVLDAIDFAHPSGSEHILVRPDIITYDVEIEAVDEGFDTAIIEQAVEEYLDGRGLGDKVYKSKIIQEALNADADIENLSRVEIKIIDEQQVADGEIIDNFDDGDLAPQDSDWGNWSGDTGSVSVQQSTVIDGTHSLDMSATGATVALSSQRSASVSPTIFETSIQVPTLTGDISDSFTVQLLDGATSLGSIEVIGNGNIHWLNGSGNPVATFSAGDVLRPTLEFNFAADEVTVYAAGSSETFALENSASGFDTVTLQNAATNAYEVYVDSLHSHNTLTYTLNKDEEDDDLSGESITDVTGTLYTSDGHTFVEDTDFQEYNTASGDTSLPHDSINWITAGDKPDPESIFFVDYYIEDDIDVELTEVAQLNEVTVTTP